MLLYIYLCKKHCHLLCWVYNENNSFLSFYSSIFHSKNIISILHVKWTVMNKGEQVENLKFWVNIFFEWLQSLLAATKIYILLFNLTHSLISLMGSFHFPQWKILFPVHWQIYKILGSWISQSFILSLKCYHPLLCEFSILFSTGKLKLGHKFSQLIHRFNIGILKCWSGAVYISKFFPIHKRDGKLGFLKSLDCISKFSPIHWKVWKLRFLSPCLHIWLNGEGCFSVRWHVASERSQFMIKLAVFNKKC